MLIPLLLALQLRAATTDGTLIIRTETASLQVPLVSDSLGPMLRPTMLAPLLPVSVVAETPGRYRLVVAGVRFGLEIGVASTSVGGQVRSEEHTSELQSHS